MFPSLQRLEIGTGAFLDHVGYAPSLASLRVHVDPATERRWDRPICALADRTDIVASTRVRVQALDDDQRRPASAQQVGLACARARIRRELLE